MLALGEDRIQELREVVHVQVSLFDALAHERTHTTKNKRQNYGVNSLVVIMPTFSTHLRAAIAHNIVASTSVRR